jgi:uncharacterized protein
MISLAPVSTADLRPLDEDDFHRLDALLDATGNENAMVVEEIDGFLAALACSPDPIGEDDLLAQVLGAEPFDDDVPTSGASGAVPAETQAEIAALLRRHAARVIAALDAGEFGPVLSYDDEGNADGVAWAVGFLRAVELHPDSWDAMLEEKDFDDALDAMQSLAAALEEADGDDADGDDADDDDADDDDADGDEDGNADTDADDDAGDDADTDEGAPSAPGSRAERDALIDRMIGDVADIHEYFRPWREAGTTPAAMRVETVRRTEPKIGRNEPCPCGSGRKYKNCCGAN